MISASPSVRILRHFNVANIVIPHNHLLKDFLIQSISYKDYELRIELLEKNHFLVYKDAVQVGTILREQSNRSESEHRSPLLK